MSASTSEFLGKPFPGDQGGPPPGDGHGGDPMGKDPDAAPEHLYPVRAEAAGEEVSPQVLWMRVLRVAILLVFWIGLELLAKAVTALQLLHLVWKKHPHRAMQRLGTMIGDYTSQLWRYCMHASDQAPWPFSPWPRGDSAQ